MFISQKQLQIQQQVVTVRSFFFLVIPYVN